MHSVMLTVEAKKNHIKKHFADGKLILHYLLGIEKGVLYVLIAY